MKKGFTLTELLIALGIVGVLAAILMPIVHNLIPDQNVLMAKRAYYTVETAVSDLINDTACYPDKSEAAGSEQRVGFDDGYGYENCLWGRDVATGTIESEGDAGNKFKTLMEDKLGALDEVVALTGDEIEFETRDGMHWKFSAGGDLRNKKACANCTITMVVDVNGKNKGDNCLETVWPSGNPTPACTDKQTPDTFRIQISEDGKVKIIDADTWAIEAVKAATSSTGS